MPTGRSVVNFTNSSGQTIYVAYMRLDHGCQETCGEPWDVLGWIKILHGSTASRPNPTSNRWFYYYAEGENGGVWNGSYPAEVTQPPFEKCTCLGVIVQNGQPTNPYHTVGFRQLDTQTYSGVNFTP